nr:phage tail protein [Treponema sp.]
MGNYESDKSRLTPYLFIVEVDGIQTMCFQKCEGLEAETEVFEYEEGGGEVHRFIGRTRFPNLILEKGIVDNDVLWKWYKQTNEGKVERKSGSVVLCNLQGEEVKRWNFFRAFPCRWIGPALCGSDRRTYAVEKIEIAYEWLEPYADNEDVVATAASSAEQKPEEKENEKKLLPNIENATINPTKLTEYALNPSHPVGGNKAIVFEKTLGYNKANSDDLIKQIHEKLPLSQSEKGKEDQYGQRYTVDISILGPNGNTKIVRTGWIIKSGDSIPYLTTLYVK